MSAVDWNAIRNEFPSLANRTYLNTATFGQLPARSIAAAQQHFAHREQTAAIDFLDWFDDLGPVRASIAQLICSEPDDIAFVPNAAYALSLAMTSVDWKPGDEMLTLHDEFPINSTLMLPRGASEVSNVIGINLRTTSQNVPS